MRTPTALLDDTLRRLAGNPTLEALASAWAAAQAPDGDPAAALEGLPVREHLVLALSLGVAVPAHLPRLSESLRRALEAAPPLDGSRLTSNRLLADHVQAALTARVSDAQVLCPLGDIDVLGAWVLDWASASLLTAGDRAGATRAATLIPHRFTLERQLAEARLAVGLPPAERDAALTRAVSTVLAAPVIEIGGEEIEALARMLGVMGALPPESAPVEAAVRGIGALLERFRLERDHRSHGTSQAAIACARHAGAAGWLDRARWLAERVEDTKQRSEAHAAIAAAEARVAADAEPLPPLPVHHPETPEPLANLARMDDLVERARGISAHVSAAVAAGELARVPELLTVALAGPDEPAVPPEVWAGWLSAVGHRSRPDAAHLATRLAETLKGYSGGPYLPGPIWAVMGEAVGHATPALLDALSSRGLHCFIEGSGAGRAITAGPALAQMTAGDPALEAQALAALATPAEHERSKGVTAWRDERVQAYLHALAERIDDPEAPARWVEALGPELAHLVHAASALEARQAPEAWAAWLPDAASEIREDLALAVAAQGRVDDTLALLEGLSQPAARAALLALAPHVQDPKVRKAVVGRFRKIKGGKGQDATIHNHQLARLLLSFDDVDQALKIYDKLKHTGPDGFGPLWLALDLLTWLAEHPTEATPQRVDAVLGRLARTAGHAEPAAKVAAAVGHAALRIDPATMGERLYDFRRECLSHSVDVDFGRLVLAGQLGAWLALGEVERAVERLGEIVRAFQSYKPSLFRLGAVLEHLDCGQLLAADPAAFDGLFGIIPNLQHFDADRVARRVPPEARRRLLTAPPPSWGNGLKGLMRKALAKVAATDGDLPTLEAALEGAQEREEAIALGRWLAVGLMRAGEDDAARATAARVGMAL